MIDLLSPTKCERDDIDLEDGEVLPVNIGEGNDTEGVNKKLKRRHKSSREKEGDSGGKHRHRHKGKHRHHRKKHRHEKEEKEDKEHNGNGKWLGCPEEKEEGQISDDGLNHAASEPESGEIRGSSRRVEESFVNGGYTLHSGQRGDYEDKKHQPALWEGISSEGVNNGRRCVLQDEKNGTSRKELQGKATKEGSPGKLKCMLDIATAYDDTSEEENPGKSAAPSMELVKVANGIGNGLEKYQALRTAQKDHVGRVEYDKAAENLGGNGIGQGKLRLSGKSDKDMLSRRANRDSNRDDTKVDPKDRRLESSEPKAESKETKPGRNREAKEGSHHRGNNRESQTQKAKDYDKRTDARKEHLVDAKSKERHPTDVMRRGDDEMQKVKEDGKSMRLGDKVSGERERASESRKRRDRSWEDDRGGKRSDLERRVKGRSRSPDSRYERRHREERIGRSVEQKVETSSRFKEEAPGSRRASVERRRRSRSRESLRREAGQKGDIERESRQSRHNDGRAFDGGVDRERKNSRLQEGSRADQSKHNHAAAYSSKSKKIDTSSQDAPIEEEENAEYLERVKSQLAAQDDAVDVEKVKEESRKRRQAILEKYRQQQSVGNGGDTVPTAGMDDGTTASPGGAQGGSPTSSSGVAGGDAELDAAFPSWGEENFVKLSRLGAAVAGSSPQADSAPDDEDDIFGESPACGRRKGKGDGVAARVTSALTDNWDDAEGYYCSRIGEVLAGRYEVIAMHGRGVFSTVVRARDLQAGRTDLPEVAIKVIRNNETMYKAGLKELVVLQKLSGQDPDNRRHCVKLVTSFEYRNHLCLVFESLHMNLREVLKKFGRNIGINLQAVRAYATQLFIALKHLRNCGVLHADIKPDNMLVNESKNTLKLADFGSAMFSGENEITPYLVSRFYRAPEIILGLPYDHALDIWSVGCCLYELYTGKMLFPGHTNNDMLRMHMELKGLFPKKMLKKAQFADQHYDQDYNFMALEEDPVTKKAVRRVITSVRPKDMGSLLAGPGTVEDDKVLLVNFKDILEKIFVLDPDKRLTVSQALNHPFISGK